MWHIFLNEGTKGNLSTGLMSDDTKESTFYFFKASMVLCWFFKIVLSFKATETFMNEMAQCLGICYIIIKKGERKGHCVVQH